MSPVRAPDQVRITTGVLEGKTSQIAGVREFLGIPYAAPPVGPLRWAPPRPAAPWTGVRKADAFGHRSVQTNPFPDMVFRSAAESEDCLYLSAWTPAQTASERLPVMFWIHGGGFFSGASDEGRHEGSVLASKGVVVIEINYRLGVLGFLAHPALSAESVNRSSGNYGLLDQVAALGWVRDNVHVFGGDPDNITIFGESAGSFSVSALMASPLTAGLFHKAIGQSGAYFSSTTLPLLPLGTAEKLGMDLAASIGDASLAELRARPAADLIKAVGLDSDPFVPILDGYMLTGDPWDVFAAGRQCRVPLLAGWNSAEVKLPPTTVTAFTTTLRTAFPNDVVAALEVYAAGTNDEASRSATAFASDNFMGYSTWKWIETHTGTGGSDVYRYLFDHVVPTATGDPPPDDSGAAHATEIEFVFHTLESRKRAWRPVDRQVADLMVAYWTNFAKTGDPNAPGLPAWPVWTSDGKGQYMRINERPHAEPETHRDRYLFQDTIERRNRGR